MFLQLNMHFCNTYCSSGDGDHFITAHFAFHSLNDHEHSVFIMITRLCNILQFFTAVKNDNFEMKNCDIFLILAQNIDRGYTLEPPH